MFLRRLLCIWISISFLSTLVIPQQKVYAQTILNLPEPGTMVNLSPVYEPVLIKGLTVHKDNPFMFDFVVDTGNSNLSADSLELKAEADRLIKYFFACLTIPEKDLWVNLSPYEKNKMVPEALGQTALGRDLLAEDYILKQLTASLIYPEKDLGKEFWNRVYVKAQKEYGTTEIPINTFNKVWILADKATVYEHNQTAFVVDGHLKVMLEEDYLAMQKHSSVKRPNSFDIAGFSSNADEVKQSNDMHSIGSQIVREIVLPEIEKEVNSGKNFAQLRQIFNSLILASWYKKNLKEALLNQVYADHSTVNGVNLNDPTVKEQIYQQYLKAYKKGVFNYIKDDLQSDGQTIPRKYFSGGFESDVAMKVSEDPEVGSTIHITSNAVKVTVVASMKQTVANIRAKIRDFISGPSTEAERVTKKTVNQYLKSISVKLRIPEVKTVSNAKTVQEERNGSFVLRISAVPSVNTIVKDIHDMINMKYSIEISEDQMQKLRDSLIAAYSGAGIKTTDAAMIVQIKFPDGTGTIMVDGNDHRRLFTSDEKQITPEPEDLEVIRRILKIPYMDKIEPTDFHISAHTIDEINRLDTFSLGEAVNKILLKVSVSVKEAISKENKDKGGHIGSLQALVNLLGSNDQVVKQTIYSPQSLLWKMLLKQILIRSGITLNSLNELQKQEIGTVAQKVTFGQTVIIKSLQGKGHTISFDGNGVITVDGKAKRSNLQYLSEVWHYGNLFLLSRKTTKQFQFLVWSEKLDNLKSIPYDDIKRFLEKNARSVVVQDFNLFLYDRGSASFTDIINFNIIGRTLFLQSFRAVKKVPIDLEGLLKSSSDVAMTADQAIKEYLREVETEKLLVDKKVRAELTANEFIEQIRSNANADSDLNFILQNVKHFANQWELHEFSLPEGLSVRDAILKMVKGGRSKEFAEFVENFLSIEWSFFEAKYLFPGEERGILTRILAKVLEKSDDGRQVVLKKVQVLNNEIKEVLKHGSPATSEDTDNVRYLLSSFFDEGVPEDTEIDIARLDKIAVRVADYFKFPDTQLLVPYLKNQIELRKMFKYWLESICEIDVVAGFSKENIPNIAARLQLAKIATPAGEKLPKEISGYYVLELKPEVRSRISGMLPENERHFLISLILRYGQRHKLNKKITRALSQLIGGLQESDTWSQLIHTADLNAYPIDSSDLLVHIKNIFYHPDEKKIIDPSSRESLKKFLYYVRSNAVQPTTKRKIEIHIEKLFSVDTAEGLYLYLTKIASDKDILDAMDYVEKEVLIEPRGTYTFKYIAPFIVQVAGEGNTGTMLFKEKGQYSSALAVRGPDNKWSMEGSKIEIENLGTSSWGISVRGNKITVKNPFKDKMISISHLTDAAMAAAKPKGADEKEAIISPDQPYEFNYVPSDEVIVQVGRSGIMLSQEEGQYIVERGYLSKEGDWEFYNKERLTGSYELKTEDEHLTFSIKEDGSKITVLVKNNSNQSVSIKHWIKTDNAMSAPGGIDLNSTNMGMTVTKDANGGVQVHFDPVMIERIKAQGVQSVVPVIINVTPVTDISALLGLKNPSS